MRDKFNPPVPQLVNRIPHDHDAWIFWVTKHGVRMTGMPAWDGVMSDDEIWKIVAFIKHSDKLPPDVQAAWQQIGPTRARLKSTPRSSTSILAAAERAAGDRGSMRTIIAISRQFGSGGAWIGRALAQRLGYDADRDILAEASRRLNVETSELEPLEERVRTFWSGIGRVLSRGAVDGPFMPPPLPSVSEVELFAAEREIIQTIADEGSAVIVGRGAAHILRDRPDVLRVFLHAPFDTRVTLAMREYALASARGRRRDGAVVGCAAGALRAIRQRARLVRRDRLRRLPRYGHDVARAGRGHRRRGRPPGPANRRPAPPGAAAAVVTRAAALSPASAPGRARAPHRATRDARRSNRRSWRS